MKHHFYSHLIEIDTVITDLGPLELSAQEINELRGIIDVTIHHVVLNTVLAELTEEDKKQFLDHLAGNNHPELWKFLTAKVPEVHEKIKQSAHAVKKEMQADIKEAHSHKKK